MDNIFKGAEFGDKYRAVDGRMAVYVRCFNKQKDWHYLLFENHIAPRGYNSDGSPRFPASYSNYIIGKWENKIVSPDVIFHRLYSDDKNLQKAFLDGFSVGEISALYKSAVLCSDLDDPKQNGDLLQQAINGDKESLEKIKEMITKKNLAMTKEQIEEARELAIAYIEANKVPEEMRDEVCSAYQAGRASVIFEMEENSL